MQDIIITNGSLILPDSVIYNGAVHIGGGKIIHIGTERDAYFDKYLKTGFSEVHRLGENPYAAQEKIQQNIRQGDALIFNAAGSYVSPALVELHIHGCGGYDIEDPAPEDPEETIIEKIASYLSQRGVGYFLPTVVYDKSVLSSLTFRIKAYKPSARILGIYMEGSFISKEKRGGIHEGNICRYDPNILEEIYNLSKGYLKMMTMAPEIPGAKDILSRIVKYKIVPAFGHSNAEYSEIAKLENVAVLNITHLYNGMSGVSHKKPGLAHWVLLNDSLYTELNCDGTHVHSAAMELTFRLRPHNRIVLISDATPAAGLPPGDDSVTMRGKRLIVKKSGVYEKESGVLVGSRLLVNDSIYRIHKEFGIPIWEAVKMASANPLRLLGVNSSGLLKEGMDADISVFDKKFNNCHLQLFHGEIMHPF